MLILRFILLAAGLFVVGLGVAFAITRDRRYVRYAWRLVQVVLLLVVAFGLLYLFERVLLMI